jgi:nickel/cobalt transporter (NicO) family protein
MKDDRATPKALLMLAIAAVGLIAAAGSATAVNPFGVVPPDDGGSFGPPSGGLFGWIAAQQAAFYRLMVGTLKELKADGNAAGMLIAVSFLYGVFHATGPGHGKAVITSYLLASRETVHKGIVIAFAAALVQGMMAIAIVMTAVLILGTTAMAMTKFANWLEVVSFGLIAAMGGSLLWAKATGRGHAHCHACQSHHDGDGHRHDHNHERSHGHVPTPGTLAGGLTFGRAWSAVLAVGIRPCSGAIIVLVFAMSQQLYAAGLVSVLAISLGTAMTVSLLVMLTLSAKSAALRYAQSGSRTVERVIHGVEVLAALFVTMLGLMLLAGALTSA